MFAIKNSNVIVGGEISPGNSGVCRICSEITLQTCIFSIGYRIDFFCCKFLGAIWDRMTTFRRFKRVLADHTRTLKKTRKFKNVFSKSCVMETSGISQNFPTLTKLLCESFVFSKKWNMKDLHSNFFNVGKFWKIYTSPKKLHHTTFRKKF